MEGVIFIIILVDVIFGFLIALFLGRKKEIGFTLSFLASVMLTPVIGLWMTFNSPDKDS